MRVAATAGCIDRKTVMARAEINVGVSKTFGCSWVIPPAVGGSIDGDEVVSGASINVGIEGTKSADVALPGCVGVDEQSVVTAA